MEQNDQNLEVALEAHLRAIEDSMNNEPCNQTQYVNYHVEQVRRIIIELTKKD